MHMCRCKMRSCGTCRVLACTRGTYVRGQRGCEPALVQCAMVARAILVVALLLMTARGAAQEGQSSTEERWEAAIAQTDGPFEAFATMVHEGTAETNTFFAHAEETLGEFLKDTRERLETVKRGGPKVTSRRRRL